MAAVDPGLDIPPFNWLETAKIYNQNYTRTPNEWIMDRVDAIILYFSLRNVDRNNIIHDFYEIYENARYTNLPIEVINIPMDEIKQDMFFSFDEQANWFTLIYGDPLIPILQYRYEITCVPHLVVIRTDATVVSTHGVMDLEQYGVNALITWLSTAASSTKPKRLSMELSMYGPSWNYLSTRAGKTRKPRYFRKYSTVEMEEVKTSLGLTKNFDD